MAPRPKCRVRLAYSSEGGSNSENPWTGIEVDRDRVLVRVTGTEGHTILNAMVRDDQALMILMRGIVGGDAGVVAQSLAESPALASSSLRQGATRQSTRGYFFGEIAHYLFAGDTPLHAAAAAHRKVIVSELLLMGADVTARNRRGAQPLHYAADGMPGSGHLDPNAQRAHHYRFAQGRRRSQRDR